MLPSSGRTYPIGLRRLSNCLPLQGNVQTTKGSSDEKDVPTEQNQKSTDTRLPRTHEHSQRARRYPSASCQGTQKISRLTRPRRHRLLRRPDFTACYEAGRRLFSRHFMVFVRFRTPLEVDWRVGFAVSKKIGPAVQRNRVKRVLREFFRLHQALLPPGMDLVVVPKRQLRPEHVTLDSVSRDLLPVLRELRGVMFSSTEERTASSSSSPSPSPQAGDCV